MCREPPRVQRAPTMAGMTVLRVLAYNLYFGGADRLEAIYNVLAHVDADVVALTEADDRKVIETLSERLGLHHVWAKGSGDRHIATLSRFPIVEWNIYNKPPLTQAVLETKLELSPLTPDRSFGDLSGVGGTPPSPDDVSRSSRQERGAGGVRCLSIYNAHFLPYLLLPFEIRRWQAVGRLLEVIRTRQPGPHLIVGDLNAIASGDRVFQHNNPPGMRRAMMLQLGLIFKLALPRLIKAGYVDCFRKLHSKDDGFTWMPGNRTTRYDYVLADSTMAARLRACRVVDDVEAVNKASDHFPLLAEFDLSNPPIL